jgi:hypothetical protein
MDFSMLFAGNYIPLREFDISLIRWFAKAARLLHDYSPSARPWRPSFT